MLWYEDVLQGKYAAYIDIVRAEAGRATKLNLEQKVRYALHWDCKLRTVPRA